jgi:hypothetical protein
VIPDIFRTPENLIGLGVLETTPNAPWVMADLCGAERTADTTLH